MPQAARLKAPSYLPTMLGTGSQGTSLLAALHQDSDPAPETVNPIEALEQATSGETRQVALVAARPQVKRDIAQFTQALATAQTPEQLLANPAALRVLLTANGLGDQAGNTALATQALLSDPMQVSSAADTSSNPRWLTVNQTYAFAEKGLSVLKDPETVNVIANGYAEELWRTNLDQTAPGLSNAIDFRQRAATITSVDQIFADPTFRAVIMTTLSLPERLASQPPGAREQAIASRVDVTKFKDPAFVDEFTRRYLIAMQQAASRAAGPVEPDLTTTAIQATSLVV
jgi:hypothetical protein